MRKLGAHFRITNARGQYGVENFSILANGLSRHKTRNYEKRGEQTYKQRKELYFRAFIPQFFLERLQCILGLPAMRICLLRLDENVSSKVNYYSTN